MVLNVTTLMTVEQICALRVNRLEAESAHLWLWVTNAAWHEQIVLERVHDTVEQGAAPS